MYKIFLCEDIDKEAYLLLKKNFIIINDFNHINECHGVLSRNLKINKSFIDQCSSLQIIGIHGSGYDDVDVQYLKEKGIHLFNTPNLNSLSVAELVISFILTMSRKTNIIDRDFKNNKIKTVAPIEYLGHEISYKTIGIIGFGHISSKVAYILKHGFQMNVIVHSQSHSKQEINDLGYLYKDSIKDVLKESDYIHIGLSLNKDTYHLFNKDLLQYIPSHAYLINTARGAIVNENDLYQFLSQHRFAGYACDVLENEPVSYNYPLLQLDNVFYTPHIGGSTTESLNRIGIEVINGFLSYFYNQNHLHLIC